MKKNEALDLLDRRAALVVSIDKLNDELEKIESKILDAMTASAPSRRARDTTASAESLYKMLPPRTELKVDQVTALYYGVEMGDATALRKHYKRTHAMLNRLREAGCVDRIGKGRYVKIEKDGIPEGL